MLCCTIYDVVNPAPNVQFYGGMCKSDIFLGFNSYKIKSVKHLFCDNVLQCMPDYQTVQCEVPVPEMSWRKFSLDFSLTADMLPVTQWENVAQKTEIQT